MGGLSWFKAILLGFVQGATEFFPVSSTGHIVLVQNYLGIRDPSKTLSMFDSVLNLGTLIAAIVFFRHDLLSLLACWISPLRKKLEQKNILPCLGVATGKRLGLLLLLGIVPAGLVSAGFHQFFEDLFSDTIMVAIFLLIMGTILHSTRRIDGIGMDFGKMNFKQSLLIGLSQIFAIFPGASRSGLTISAGLFLKLNPETAFRFSFLMMIPIVAGSVIYDLREGAHFPLEEWGKAILGAIIAGVVGFFSLKMLLRLMKEGHFANFAWYCWAVGGFVILKELFF
ncbi:MAG: undecaprenyl-diphosphate phosphatase [Deltaproteobacteria bacterium]|nr:undecaprenyl-diphosphate phosphatase [Deltaproteobacteria bacterium]